MPITENFPFGQTDYVVKHNSATLWDQLTIMEHEIGKIASNKELKEFVNMQSLKTIVDVFRSKFNIYAANSTLFKICGKELDILNDRLLALRLERYNPNKQEIESCEKSFQQKLEQYNKLKAVHFEGFYALNTVFKIFCDVIHRAEYASRTKSRIVDQVETAKKPLKNFKRLFSEPVNVTFTVNTATNSTTEYTNGITAKTNELCRNSGAKEVLDFADNCQLTAIQQLENLKKQFEVINKDCIFGGDYKTLETTAETFYKLIMNVNQAGDQVAEQSVKSIMGDTPVTGERKGSKKRR